MNFFPVQEGNGKWSDTTAGAAFSAWDGIEERGSGLAKPLIGLAKKRWLRGKG
jgi:hypothetical protein